MKMDGKQDIIHFSLALERTANVLIESIIDVGNSMIDGFDHARIQGVMKTLSTLWKTSVLLLREMAGPLKECARIYGK